jgi:hypothetical protein
VIKNNYQKQIVILINSLSIPKEKSVEYLDKIAENIINEIQIIDKSSSTIYHVGGTNVVFYIPSWRGKELSNNLKKIERIKNIAYYYLFSDYIEEINIAKETHDYFKAYSLGCSIFEYYGKKILREYFIKHKTSIKDNKIQKLNLESIIILLYTHKIIKEGVFSDMVKITKIRNDFIHSGVIEVLSLEKLKETAENIDKIKKCILVLKSNDDSYSKN